MQEPICKLPPFTIDAMFMAMSEVIDWSLAMTGTPDTWKQTQGEGVKVAILDTGCYLAHFDLDGAIEDAADFTGSRFGPIDKNAHGTFCAGVVAARQNDSGCVGVAPRAKLLIGKCLGDDGSGSSRMVAQSIRWAIDKKADVISMSLGSPQPSQEIHEAIKAAVAAGIHVCAAAGNSGPNPGTVEWPGKFPECITVGAINKQRQVSRFSSRGPEVCCLAPGEAVTSLGIRTPLVQMSGTSMATPFVAGVVALCVAKHKKQGGATPVNTPKQMKEHLQKTAVDVDAPGFDPNAGWGLVSPLDVLKDATPPVPPTIADLLFTPDDLTPAGRAKLAAFRSAKSITLKLE